MLLATRSENAYEGNFASSYCDPQTFLAFSPLQHKDTGSLFQLPELENLTPMK